MYTRRPIRVALVRTIPLSLFVLLMKPIPPWQTELAFGDRIVSNLAAGR